MAPPERENTATKSTENHACVYKYIIIVKYGYERSNLTEHKTLTLSLSLFVFLKMHL